MSKRIRLAFKIHWTPNIFLLKRKFFFLIQLLISEKTTVQEVLVSFFFQHGNLHFSDEQFPTKRKTLLLDRCYPLGCKLEGILMSLWLVRVIKITNYGLPVSYTYCVELNLLMHSTKAMLIRACTNSCHAKSLFDLHKPEVARLVTLEIPRLWYFFPLQTQRGVFNLL